jgi:hypothetical protein
MKIYKLLFIFCFFLYAAHIKAQQIEFSDKVYLKNGSRIVGKILFYQPEDTVQVKVESGQILRFAPQQILKVRMSEIAGVKTSRAERPYSFKERGMYDALSFNINLGRSSYSANQGIGFQNVVGYQFSRLVGTGIGVSYDSYYIANGQSDVISVFGEYRGYLNKRNTTEYITFAAGYGHPKSNKNEILTNRKGSFMVQPTIGLRFGASNRYNFFADLGFRWQQVRFEEINTWRENRYTVMYRRWILRGGILF